MEWVRGGFSVASIFFSSFFFFSDGDEEVCLVSRGGKAFIYFLLHISDGQAVLFESILLKRMLYSGISHDCKVSCPHK